MKKTMNWITRLVIIILVMSAAWYAAIERVAWVENLFLFYTWTSLGLIFFGVVHAETKVYLINGYREGRHLPALVNWWYYLAGTAIVVSQGWFITGVAWLFRWMFDAYLRSESEKG